MIDDVLTPEVIFVDSKSRKVVPSLKNINLSAAISVDSKKRG